MAPFSKKLLQKKWLLVLLIGCFFCLLIFITRIFLLQALSNFLIDEDGLQKCDAIFVLSGNAMERATEAASLYHQGIAKKIICTGGNKCGELEVLNIHKFESDMTHLRLLQMQIPDSLITVIHSGTSTYEEGNVVSDFCKNNNISSCIIVSGKLHTRRINFVFHKKFKNSSTQIFVHGAMPQAYDLNKWWSNEYGLLAVFDEYVKLIYYHLKY